MLQPLDHQVFLIDEDEAVRDSLKVLLDSHGIQTRDFRDAAEFSAAGQDLAGDCLILGYNRLNAESLSQISALRRRGIAYPIILIAGGQDAAMRAAAISAGAFACLSRPVDEATLVRTIKATLKAKGARPCSSADRISVQT